MGVFRNIVAIIFYTNALIMIGLFIFNYNEFLGGYENEKE